MNRIQRAIFQFVIFCLGVGYVHFSGHAETNFLPTNTLWLEDNLFENSNITQEQFDKVIFTIEKIYLPIASKEGENIVVNRLWEDPTVNANTIRITSEDQIVINMFGGLARRPEITPDALALVLCHELGHAYGGMPYRFPQNRLSAEGIADTYAAGTCLSLVLPHIAPTDASQNNLERALDAGFHLAQLLAKLSNETEPSYATPDTTEVSQTEVSYPKTTQCRLDTFHNAIFKLEKPRCWFKPESQK